MPLAASVPDAPRRLSRPPAWLPSPGDSPWSLLCRLLLAPDGAVVHRGRDERAVDLLLALLVLLEKLTPVGRWIARAAGMACVTQARGCWCRRCGDAFRGVMKQASLRGWSPQLNEQHEAA